VINFWGEGEEEGIMKFYQRLRTIVIFIMVMGLSISGYPQKREPDVHFEPTPEDVVEAMLKMAEVTKEDMVYDLGCGDGRFVITAAKKYGARGVGVDIDPRRIRESNENAKKANVESHVRFIEGDLFETSIRGATVVTLYLLNELNLQLRPKLLRELKPGTRIVSHTFDMGDWEPDKIGEVRDRTFYYWVIPARVAGTWYWSFPSSIGRWQNQLVLFQEFQEVSGKVNMQGWELRIREPLLTGDQLSFKIRYNSEGQNVTMRFKGRLNGDTIKGSVEIRGGLWAGTHEWIANRFKN
jgi:SAM-dependent methyltransferase